MVCESGGSKSWLAKAAAVEPPDQRRNENLHTAVARSTFSKCHKHDEKWHASWREACFQVKMLKPWGAPANIFRSPFNWNASSLEMCEAGISTVSSAYHMPKSARHCGAKHISKSKCTKHTIFGPLSEDQMPKKCMPLWREAHFQVR